MRKSRYTEAQIVSILKELDAGRPAGELARGEEAQETSIPQARSHQPTL